jgi:retron-type reverse transcriptase
VQGYNKVRQFHTDARLLADSTKSVGIMNATYQVSQDLKHRHIYKKICDLDTLIIAYEKLNSKLGSIVDRDSLSLKKLENIQKSLIKETYKCKPTKRVLISNKDGRKHFLGIPSFNDRLVQQAAKMTIENIFENKFIDESHGYRPQRSCHSALNQVSI